MNGDPNNWAQLLAVIRPEDVLRAVDLEEIDKIIARLDEQAAFWGAMREQALAANVDACESLENHGGSQDDEQPDPLPPIELPARVFDEIDAAKKKAEAASASGTIEEEDPDAWMDLPPKPTDPIGKRISGNELIESRAERVLLVLNQLGPTSMSQLARAIGQSDMVVRYAMKKLPGAFVRVGSNGSKWAATRVSDKWADVDEAMFGKPQVVAPDAEEPEDDVPKGDDAESEDDDVLPMAPDLPTDAEDGPNIVEEKVEWLNAGQHREYGECHLCDSKFASHEEICVAKDKYGKSVMCKPCARRAGYQPPKRAAS